MIISIRSSVIGFFCVLVILSCKTSNETLFSDSDTKYYNGEYAIDMNEDGLLDVKMDIRFFVFGDRNLTYFYLMPLNGAQLYCEENKEPHYFSKYDTVYFEPQLPQYWSSEALSFMHCKYYRTNWRGEWAGKTGYVGIKLKADSAAYCAWLNITADTLRESNLIFNFSEIQKNPRANFLIE